MGGSGIAPFDQNLFANISEIFFQSKLSYGPIERYFIVNKSLKVKDWPSMNFFIKKNIFLSLKGFDENIYPGEDSILCSKLVKAGIDINYFPNIFVYHKRRETLKLFIKQIFLYGYNRGRISFNKGRYSFELKYALPSVYFLLFIIFLFFCFNDEYIFFSKIYYLILLIFYFFTFLELTVIRKVKIFKSLSCFFFAPLGHLVYGFGSIIGFLSTINKQ